MKFETGTEATFTAYFFSEGTTPAVLDETPEVSFYEPDDTPALEAIVAAVVNTAPGVWEATITIPDSTEPGWYKILWHGLLDSQDLYGAENFEIVEYGTVVPLTYERNLRRRLNDKLDDGQDDSEAFYTDDEIHSILAMAGNDVIRASLDGWAIKMAYFQDAIDVIESGAERKMSQLFRQAKQMCDFYRGEVDAREADIRSSMAPVVGVAASLRNECSDVFGLRYNPFSLSTSAPYVRIFELKRFMPYYDGILANGWAR